ncbi:uncharacterized protein SOCE26_074680 [Sorangium cellulosum]|uniref:Methyltransferase domain-containing protein n=1 Tax=Sorangium cellulosum TaxID=56 RepID=A0A2L0F347_SORCE|nr:uncharacterized protein SOCE26_074680 [Sorangium cellulosum]
MVHAGVTSFRRAHRGAARLLRTVRVLGGIDTVLAAIAAYALQLPAKRGKAFDERFGIETTEPVVVNPRDYIDDSYRSAIWYFPSIPEVFDSVMQTLKIRAEEYAFVDVGCGKGRVLIMAAQLPFRRVLGVESSTATASIARTNVGVAAGRSSLRAPVDVLTCNALSFDFPPVDLLIYLYNPFSKLDAYVEFLGNLEVSLKAHPRKVVLVYTCPEHVRAFEECHFLEPIARYELLVSEYTWCAFTNTRYRTPRADPDAV